MKMMIQWPQGGWSRPMSKKAKKIKMSLLDSPDADRGAALTRPESDDIFSTQKRI